MSQIFIIGHKSPDLDSAAGAISYAKLKNAIEKTKKYIPVIAGNINKETKYSLRKFNFNTPKILKSAKNKKIILVDHNEFSQAVLDIEKSQIIEIIDHHKLDFKYNEPIKVNIKPWGSVCSIICQEFFNYNIKINKNLAGLMLSAILVDTVITKSPTCTKKDIKIIKQLASIAKIDNWKNFGMELFKVRSSVSKLSEIEIIKSDYKDFLLKAGKFGIGQVETVNLKEFDNRKEKILKELKKIKTKNNYHTVILFLTDIINEGSLFLIATDDLKNIEKAFNKKFDNNKTYIKGIISRKKQVIPKLSKIFDK